MIRITWARNLIVEKSRQNERNRRTSRRTNVGQHRIEGVDTHSYEVGQHDDNRGDDREFQIPNNLDWASMRIKWSIARRGVEKWSRTVRTRASRATLQEPSWAELKHRDTRSSTRMNLQRIRKHDQNNNRQFSNRGRNVRLVHPDDVTRDIVAEGEVPGDGDDDVDCACRANGGDDDGGDYLGAVVADLVDDGEHVLVAGVGEDDDWKGG